MSKMWQSCNHWQSVCPSGKRKQHSQGAKAVLKHVIHTTEDWGNNDNSEIPTVSTIEVNTMEDMQKSRHNRHNKAFATFEIIQPQKKHKNNLQCMLDTGAESNV